MLGVQVNGTTHLLKTSLHNVNHEMNNRKLDQRVKRINFPGHRLLLNAKNTFRQKISYLRDQKIYSIHSLQEEDVYCAKIYSVCWTNGTSLLRKRRAAASLSISI